MDRPFAYVTEEGQIVLLGEIAQEVRAALLSEGDDVHEPVVEEVMRAFRYVTEAVAQEGSPYGDVPTRVQETLRRRRVIVGEARLRAILHQLMRCLAAAGVVGVSYYRP